MAWNGTEKPCGVGTLMSIGCLGVEENKKHASVLYPLLEKELGIPGDRFVPIPIFFLFTINNIILYIMFLDYTLHFRTKVPLMLVILEQLFKKFLAS